MRRNLLALAAFVTICLGLLAGLAWQLGVFAGRGELYTVRLEDAGGLVVGNAVRIAGVEVGRIRSVRLEDNRAVLELALDRGISLYSGDCAKPRPKSLLGEKYLHLDQGRAASGPMIPPGAEITCTHEMIDVGDALEGLAPILHSKENIYPVVVRILKRLDAVTASLEALTVDGSGQGAAGRAGSDDDVDDDDDVEGSTRAHPRGDGLEGMASGIGGLVDESRGAVGLSREILAENREDIRAIVQASRRHLSDPRLGRAIANLEVISRDGRSAVARLDRIAERTEAIVERLDRHLGDERFADLGALVSDGRAAMKSLRGLAESVSGIGKSTSNLLDSLVTLAGRAASITERDLRKFLQDEGIRARIIPDRGVRQRIDDLERSDP